MCFLCFRNDKDSNNNQKNKEVETAKDLIAQLEMYDADLAVRYKLLTKRRNFRRVIWEMAWDIKNSKLLPDDTRQSILQQLFAMSYFGNTPPRPGGGEKMLDKVFGPERDVQQHAERRIAAFLFRGTEHKLVDENIEALRVPISALSRVPQPGNPDSYLDTKEEWEQLMINFMIFSETIAYGKTVARENRGLSQRTRPGLMFPTRLQLLSLSLDALAADLLKEKEKLNEKYPSSTPEPAPSTTAVEPTSKTKKRVRAPRTQRPATTPPPPKKATRHQQFSPHASFVFNALDHATKEPDFVTSQLSCVSKELNTFLSGDVFTTESKMLENAHVAFSQDAKAVDTLRFVEAQTTKPAEQVAILFNCMIAVGNVETAVNVPYIHIKEDSEANQPEHIVKYNTMIELSSEPGFGDLSSQTVDDVVSLLRIREKFKKVTQISAFGKCELNQILKQEISLGEESFSANFIESINTKNPFFFPDPATQFGEVGFKPTSVRYWFFPVHLQNPLETWSLIVFDASKEQNIQCYIMSADEDTKYYDGLATTLFETVFQRVTLPSAQPATMPSIKIHYKKVVKNTSTTDSGIVMLQWLAALMRTIAKGKKVKHVKFFRAVDVEYIKQQKDVFKKLLKDSRQQHMPVESHDDPHWYRIEHMHFCDRLAPVASDVIDVDELTQGDMQYTKEDLERITGAFEPGIKVKVNSQTFHSFFVGEDIATDLEFLYDGTRELMDALSLDMTARFLLHVDKDLFNSFHYIPTKLLQIKANSTNAARHQEGLRYMLAGVDLLQKDNIIFPLTTDKKGSHYAVAVVTNLKYRKLPQDDSQQQEPTVYIVDSLKSDDNIRKKRFADWTQLIEDFCDDYMVIRNLLKKARCDTQRSVISTRAKPPETVFACMEIQGGQQNNSIDCGFYACCFVEFILLYWQDIMQQKKLTKPISADLIKSKRRLLDILHATAKKAGPVQFNVSIHSFNSLCYPDGVWANPSEIFFHENNHVKAVDGLDFSQIDQMRDFTSTLNEHVFNTYFMIYLRYFRTAHEDRLKEFIILTPFHAPLDPKQLVGSIITEDDVQLLEAAGEDIVRSNMIIPIIGKGYCALVVIHAEDLTKDPPTIFWFAFSSDKNAIDTSKNADIAALQVWLQIDDAQSHVVDVNLPPMIHEIMLEQGKVEKDGLYFLTVLIENVLINSTLKPFSASSVEYDEITLLGLFEYTVNPNKDKVKEEDHVRSLFPRKRAQMGHVMYNAARLMFELPEPNNVVEIE